MLSLPGTALAALDLADRIHKRQRAHQLITHAQHLASQRITIHLISDTRQLELASAQPDHILDLATDDNHHDETNDQQLD